MILTIISKISILLMDGDLQDSHSKAKISLGLVLWPINDCKLFLYI